VHALQPDLFMPDLLLVGPAAPGRVP